METVQMKARTDEDGSMSLTVPTPLQSREVEVTITYRPLAEEAPLDAMGRPVGWIERTYGSIPDLERLPQGEYEQREEW